MSFNVLVHMRSYEVKELWLISQDLVQNWRLSRRITSRGNRQLSRSRLGGLALKLKDLHAPQDEDGPTGR